MPSNETTGAGTGPEPTADDTAPRRTRRRPAKAAPSAQPEIPELAASVNPEPAADEAPARSRRRRVAPEPDAVGDSTQEPVKAAKASRTRRRTAADETTEVELPAAVVVPAAKATRTRKAAKAAAPVAEPEPAVTEATPAEAPRAGRKAATPPAVLFMAPEVTTPVGAGPVDLAEEPPARATRASRAKAAKAAPAGAAAPTPVKATGTRATGTKTTAAKATKAAARPVETAEPEEQSTDLEAGRTRRSRRSRRTEEPVEVEQPAAPVEEEDEDDDSAAARRRRRGRRGRGRGKGTAEDGTEEPLAAEGEGDVEGDEAVTRRRRRRRRGGAGADSDVPADEEGVVTVVRIRQPRAARDEVQGVTGSTRLEAKRQRRRDGREQRRTRPPILSESEFLARREAVDRVMVVRQKGDRTQVAVLEDGILVEHYVTRQSASTMVGNVYLGKVQNVLPSMEAAFVDIGRGRNAVLYAGEVNWDASGLEGRARSIEQALKSGESVLVQVTKDPVGHKGARLTSHVALSGRHLVYVPNGHASGISRKLSDVERRRLRDILKNLVPDSAGVIVRTAAEGAAEEDLENDVRRLQSQWDEIQKRAGEQSAPALLSAEPDLVIRVVRDLFNEDFREVVIQGPEAYEQVESYLAGVSPDLVARVRRHTGPTDAFAEFRIDEQILKGLDRKVYLPSGGHLVIDRTEAMTVVDVNTGKYTGAGGNLEETVTRNNLEAAEEIVRQLRLRDLGGIVVIDFIDMVLESNRDLVLRRLTECLGRDRTKHQVTEITSLGLVQMTRKRIGQGLLEAFSEPCDHCKGRGVIIQTDPVPARASVAEKVRAVAASVSPKADGPVLGEDQSDDIELPPPGEDNELVTVEDGDDEPAGSTRRRTRRGSSRRRTRP